MVCVTVFMWIWEHVCILARVFVCVCICFSVCIRLCLYRKKAAKRCCSLMCRVVLSILRFMFFSGLLAFVARVSQFVSVIPRFIYIFVHEIEFCLKGKKKKVHKNRRKREQKKLHPKINRPTKSVVLVNVHIFIGALFWGNFIKKNVAHFRWIIFKSSNPNEIYTKNHIVQRTALNTKLKGSTPKGTFRRENRKKRNETTQEKYQNQNSKNEKYKTVAHKSRLPHV